MKNLMLLLILLTTVALAQPRRAIDAPPMRGIHLMERMNLTEEQRRQIDKLHSELQKKQIALRAKIQSARVDVRDAFREDKPERAKIESKLNEITKAQGEMRNNQLVFWFDVYKILAPEQQKIWKEAPMTMRGKAEMARRKFRAHERMRIMMDDPEDD